MRMLGFKSPVQMFRWDLVYLAAQLLSDDRAEVKALAAPVQTMLLSLNEERAALEKAEDDLVFAIALLRKRDRDRDAVLVEAGGVARARDKEVYAILFGDRNPTETA